MRLKFTNKMKLPENFASIINDSTKDKKLLEIVMINGDSQEIDKNLRAWTVSKASSTQIDISLTFDKPLSVSQGDSPDIILI